MEQTPADPGLHPDVTALDEATPLGLHGGQSDRAAGTADQELAKSRDVPARVSKVQALLDQAIDRENRAYGSASHQDVAGALRIVKLAFAMVVSDDAEDDRGEPVAILADREDGKGQEYVPVFPDDERHPANPAYVDPNPNTLSPAEVIQPGDKAHQTPALGDRGLGIGRDVPPSTDANGRPVESDPRTGEVLRRDVDGEIIRQTDPDTGRAIVDVDPVTGELSDRSLNPAIYADEIPPGGNAPPIPPGRPVGGSPARGKSVQPDGTVVDPLNPDPAPKAAPIAADQLRAADLLQT